MYDNVPEKVGYVLSSSDSVLLLWGLLKSGNNRGTCLPRYMLPTLVQSPLIMYLRIVNIVMGRYLVRC